MLCLNQIENATPEERKSGLYQWAKVFRATTWEELRALAENSKVIYDTIVTMAELSDDEKVQQQCLREEKYERDMLNLRNSSLKEGQKIEEKAGESDSKANRCESWRGNCACNHG